MWTAWRNWLWPSFPAPEMVVRGIQRIHRFVKRNSLRAPILVLAGMTLLLSAQFLWWIIFFQINHENQLDRIQEREELIRLLLRNNTGEQIASPLLERDDDGIRLKEEPTGEYRRKHRQQLWMLISETLFVLLVIVYGSYRILRSIYREHRLVAEREIFLNSVTHELKTPLASILLNIQTLQKRKLSPSLRTELLEESILEVRRLEEQINNILLSGQLSRRVGGRQEAEGNGEKRREKTDLAGEIIAYIDENSNRFHREGVEIRMELPSSPLFSSIQPHLFQKILSNLVQNAIQYSHEKVRIRIILEEKRPSRGGKNKSPRILLKVEDNGPGIPEGERKEIFKPFYRIKNDNRRVKGSGVGLYIVQEIVRGAGGSLHLRTRPEFPGSSFEITLPPAAT